MNTENNIEIGDRIKEIRIQRGIKQKDLAKILDMPVSTLANYETNRRPVSLETLKKISEALEVPLESILGIKTMDVRYYKLNQITEEFERVGNDLREKLKEAKELEKKEGINDSDQEKIKELNISIQTLRDAYIRLLRKQKEYSEELDTSFDIEIFPQDITDNFSTSIKKIAQEPYWLFSQYVKKQFNDKYSELLTFIEPDLLEMFERTNDYIELLLMREYQKLSDEMKMEIKIKP